MRQKGTKMLQEAKCVASSWTTRPPAADEGREIFVTTPSPFPFSLSLFSPTLTNHIPSVDTGQTSPSSPFLFSPQPITLKRPRLK